MLTKEDFKSLRYVILIFSAIIITYAWAEFSGYRLLDVFGSEEWRPDGKPASGSHHYYHK